MRLVQVLIEILNGNRSASQLIRWVTPEVMTGVKLAIKRKRFSKLIVRSIHVHETDDGVAEVSAVFGTANRSFALALRLEGLDGKWRATSIVWGF
jgi:metal-responsive CopG/Arc/MetJ family transcriptional regulator